MLETIREYALEQLEAAGELEAPAGGTAPGSPSSPSSLDAESRTGDQAARSPVLADDYPNLRAAIERAREDRRRRAAASARDRALAFWSTRGYVAEGRQALEDALELAGRRPARALLGLSSLRVFSGNSDGLLDDVQEVLRACEELGDPLTPRAGVEPARPRRGNDPRVAGPRRGGVAGRRSRTPSAATCAPSGRRASAG